MTEVIYHTREGLENERAQLLAEAKVPEEELRERGANYKINMKELHILVRLNQIDYLLGKETNDDDWWE